MRLLYILFILMSTTCCGSLLSIAPPDNPEYNKPRSLVGDALDHTVALVNDDEEVFCSGVISRGLVLTAHHCIDGEEPWKVARYSAKAATYGVGTKYRVIAIDEKNDFAVLQAQEYVLEGGMPLAIDQPVWGQQVVVVGHPHGLDYTMTEGIVSHPRREVNGRTWMQVSAPVTYGNSGGPVFTRHGEVIGIVSFMFGRERHLAGVVHIDVITHVIQKITEKED